MKANDSEPPADPHALRPRLAALGRHLSRLVLPLFLALGLGATCAWVVFLIWAAFCLLGLLIA